MTDRIENRARFDLIRYANCWEDADILCEALLPLEGKRVLSIASAGDNSLSLAAEGAHVVAADLSPAQIAVVELRCAAFRRLDHDGVLRFLGVRPDEDRVSVYDRLAKDLSEESSAFWNAHREEVTLGIIHAGRFERYFRFFRRLVLPLIHGRKDVERLLEPKEEGDRLRFYEDVWDNVRWRLLFRAFFSKYVMGRMGRDPEFFRYVEGSVSDRILSRARYALTVLPTHRNPYLHYILNGNFSGALPRYLEPGRFDAIRNGLDRMTLHRGPVEEAADAHAQGGFDGFNLSDIFEYLDPDTCRGLYSRLLSHANPGARFVYWNMLVPRRCPRELSDHVADRADRADPLFKIDRAFFYSAFVVEEVRA